MILEILLVLALILINGVLAMSEIAVVSSRPARLRMMQEKGSRAAGTALALSGAPGRFLSTVQIGITLVGVLSGAFSGATIGQRLADGLAALGMDPSLAETLGVGAVVVLITYLSLILGELVPKQLALRDPERMAARIAPGMHLMSRIAGPIVTALDISQRIVLRLIGKGGKLEGRVTDEEVRTIIAEAESAGVIETEERSMIAGVMRLADRSARGLMTPRPEVELLDLGQPEEAIERQLRETRRSRLPVHEGKLDAIVGVIALRAVLADPEGTFVERVRRHVQTVPVVMDAADALSVLRALRASTVHMALVFDEYGHFEGIITSGDFLEAITGAFTEELDEEPAILRRADGSWLVSGWMKIDEFADTVGYPVGTPNYETVAGLVLDKLTHLPKAGEVFDDGEWRIEVVDLDNRRIDKIIVSRRS